MRKLLLLVLLALAMAAWNSPAVNAIPKGREGPPDDGFIDNARESDPLQHGGPGGHLPPTQLNVDLVGKVRFHDAEKGIVSDVGELRNYAYLGQFSPGCAADGAGGAYVVDISNPAHPTEVGFIPAHAGSYVGEGVHAIHIDTDFFTGDVLALNNEICGPGGLGGVSLWDITDPRHPVVVSETGLLKDLDPFAIGPYGNGTTNFNHDMYVRKIVNTWTLVSSYWDAGYLKFNVNDPAH